MSMQLENHQRDEGVRRAAGTGTRVGLVHVFERLRHDVWQGLAEARSRMICESKREQSAGLRKAVRHRRIVVLVAVVLALGTGSSVPALGSRAAATSAEATARIAFMTFLPRSPFQTTLTVVNADGSGRQALTRTAWNGEAPAWSPDGEKLAFERRVSPLVNGQCACNIDLFVMNADGSGQQNLTRNPVYDRHPVWSPDGQRLAFIRYRDVWVMNADGSEQRRLTPNRQGDDHPVWSPDGQQIAFTSFRRFNWDVWVMNADGGGHRNLTQNRAQDSSPRWSPDGSKIAFVRTRNSSRIHDRNWEIYVMEADGSGQRNLTRNPAADSDPAWSPDGWKIAFVSNRDGNAAGEIFVMNADGSGLRRLTRAPGADSSPAWSPDGRKIAFISIRDGERAIYVMNADGSGQRNLSPGIRHLGAGFSWSPGRTR
jgi:Tol biopolymer transport system component